MASLKKIGFIVTLVLLSVVCVAQSRYISSTTKKVVYTRDGGKCQCCGSFNNLEYDHITPFSCGGKSIASNIQLLCKKCNRSKSNSCICKVHNKKVGTNCCDNKTSNKKSAKHTSTTKKQTNTSAQCIGLTKKGTRCKNRTTSANGRCHLH